MLAWFDRSRSRPAVAPDARSVRDPRQRGDAAADAGRACRPALRARGSSGGRRAAALAAASPGDVIRRVAGPRLQPARARAPPRGASRRGRRMARRPHRAPRCRPVHRGRAPELRLRRGRAPARRQRRARRAAHRRRVLGRGRPGADGSRRDDLPRPDPALRHMPARERAARRAARGTSRRGSSRASRARSDSAAPTCSARWPPQPRRADRLDEGGRRLARARRPRRRRGRPGAPSFLRVSDPRRSRAAPPDSAAGRRPGSAPSVAA